MLLLLKVLFLLTAFVVASVLLAALAQRSRARAAVGSLLVVHGTRRRRRLALLVYLGLALWGCLLLSEFGQGPFLAAGFLSLAGAVALVVLPTHDEGWIGTRGVRLGWLARTWGSIDSWRLVGEHFRFSVDDRWRSIPVAAENFADVRAVLDAAAPGTESALS